jgi:hypothetical protein
VAKMAFTAVYLWWVGMLLHPFHWTTSARNYFC